MKIWVQSPYRNNIKKRLERLGVKVTPNDPTFVITYGGDGTILRAETKFPGIPKVPIRKSRICSMCVSYGIDNIKYIVDRLISGNYKIEKVSKVEARILGKKTKLVGLNEVQIHNKDDPSKAIRFSLSAGKRFEELIGDGLVIATKYGSTAYYRSLGYENFDKGVRIGFNNVYPKEKSILLEGTARIKILRERGLLISDNNGKIQLKPGDIIEVKKSKLQASFVRF